MSILDVFCSVDAFGQQFEPLWEQQQVAAGRHRRRATRLHPSEIMTILILFQQSGYRTFKGFHTQHVQTQLRAEFPRLVSYTRFVDLMPRMLVPLAVYLHTQLGTCTGISFVDATSLSVCRNPRIAQHRVFRADARCGKTTMGWFYGFKLHLVVNDRGELLAICLTPGNVNDRHPVPRLMRRLFGKLVGDRGYISQALAEELLVQHGIHLVTKARKNMRGRLLSLADKLLLRKRAIIESVNDQLKNVCQIEHTRHRGPYNFLAHLLAGLIAYCPLPKKPSLHLDQDLLTLPAA